MAQRSKYGGVTPYFGHRKRGCEATSSPSAPAIDIKPFRSIWLYFFTLFLTLFLTQKNYV